MRYIKPISLLLAFRAVAFCGTEELVIKLPPGGLLVEVPGHGNVIVTQAAGGSLSIVVIPSTQVPNAGPSFSISRSEAYSEPELAWVVVHESGRDYVTVRKSEREQLPSTTLTHTYIDDFLRQITVKKFEHTIKQEGVREVARSPDKEQVKSK
jgi:hypothetical protein